MSVLESCDEGLLYLAREQVQAWRESQLNMQEVQEEENQEKHNDNIRTD